MVAESPTREQVVEGFLTVLFEQGIEKIPPPYRRPVIDEVKKRLADQVLGFWFFWLNLAWIHVKGRGEGKGWQRACPQGCPRAVEETGKSWAWQADFAREITRFPVLLILKARQIGFTYIIANLVIWVAIAFPEQIIAVCANKLTGSKRIMRRAREVYYRLPAWLKDEVKLTNPALAHLEFSNGSYIEPYSGDPNAARGDAATLLVADEIGEFEYLNEFYSAVESVADWQIYFGTAKFNGLERWVEDAAAGPQVSSIGVDSDGIIFEIPFHDQGANGMTFAFVPWMVHPHHDSVWMDTLRRNYRGNLRDLEREHPSTWQEAFQATGVTYYDLESLKKQITVVRNVFEKRDRRGTLLPVNGDFRRPIFVEDSYGHVVIHAMEDEFAEFMELRRPSVIGADCAGDRQAGDYQAASSLLIGNVPEPGQLDFDFDTLDPHRQLITIHGHMDGDHYAELLFMAGCLLGEAVIGVEANGVGTNVIKVLRRMRYPRLYMRRTRPRKVNEKPSDEYGWYTNNETKNIAYGEGERLLRNDFIEIRDLETLNEMLNVQNLGASKIGAREPKHDDRPDGLMIACALVPYARLHAGRRSMSVGQKGPGYGTLEWLLEQMDREKGRKDLLGTEMSGMLE